MPIPHVVQTGINREVIESFVENLRNMTEYGNVFQDAILEDIAMVMQDTKFAWSPDGNLMIERKVQTGARHCGASTGILAADLKTMTLQQFFARVMTIAYAHQLFV